MHLADCNIYPDFVDANTTDGGGKNFDLIHEGINAIALKPLYLLFDSWSQSPLTAFLFSSGHTGNPPDVPYLSSEINHNYEPLRKKTK